MFRGIFRAVLFKSMVFNQPTNKVKAFKEAHTPRNVTELRSPLGMLVALTNFIPQVVNARSSPIRAHWQHTLELVAEL